MLYRFVLQKLGLSQMEEKAIPVKVSFSHPFKADFNDHFETSIVALRDVLPVVEELRQLTRPSTPENFTLYDPYYCNGIVVQHWHALGVNRVLHENRDFYKDIVESTVPGPFDMLITNPPFSEDHIQRLMEYLVTSSTPWAFLAPDYIATKQWYKEFICDHFTLTSTTDVKSVKTNRNPVDGVAKLMPELPPFLQHKLSQQQQQQNSLEKTEKTLIASEQNSSLSNIIKMGMEPFYIVPRVRYDYEHPTGAGHAHSHFKSMWYVFVGKRTKEVVRATQIRLLQYYKDEQQSPKVIQGLTAVLGYAHRQHKRARSQHT